MVQQPLTLINLMPDRDAFALWSAQYARFGNRVSDAGMPDTGYAWHGLLRSVFGSAAPKPFVDRIALRSNNFLGYVDHAPNDLAVSSDIEPLARRALGLERLRSREMPTCWLAGQVLSFEVRVRPVVRTRRLAHSGNHDEMDVAVHAALDDPHIPRELAYQAWLERELGRDGAATLQEMKTLAFRRMRVTRRKQGEVRKAVTIEGPDLWVCGHLKIRAPDAFDALLRRGLGRHRAFGFGCLLVGRPGVLTSQC